MATREKKARSVTADSPTPSLGSAHSSSNSNISTIGGTPTSTTGTAAAETKGAGGATSTGGGGGDGGGSLSAPTTPTSSRKGAGAAANVNSGGGGSVAATGGGSGGSTASSASSSSSTRASLSRLKSKQLLLGDDPVANEEPVALAGSEGASSTTTTPSRTTRRGGSIARDDSAGVDANAPAASAASSKDKEDMPLSAAAGTSKDLTKSPAIGARRAAAVAAAAVVGSSSKQSTAAGKGEPTVANSRKHRVVSLKRTALLKRKGKKIIGKPILGKKVVARRQLAASVAATKGKSSTVRGASSTAMPMKKETTATISPASTGGSREDTASDLLSTPSLRNGKPRNSDSPVAKRKSAGSALKREINKSPDQQLIKLERRRSCSVSKFSSEDGGEGTAAAGFEFKRELLDDEVRSKMLDKMAEAFNGRKLEVATPGGTLRRSMRQRKSTARDKDDFVTPRLKGASSMVDIKVELDTAEDDEADGGTPQTEPLTIDTSEAEKQDVPLHSDGAASASSIDETVSEVGVDGAGDVGVVGVGETPELVEKDASLSPELISEGVSELSVKECYSEPAFLENNLGIEKDPKLGEIVQGRFRCDKVSDDSGACEEEEEEEEEEGKMNASGVGGGGGDEEAHAQGQSVVSVVEEVKDVTEEDGKEEPVVVPDSASVEIVKQKDCESEDVQDQLMIVDEEDQPAEVVDDGMAATATLSSECKLDEDLLNEEAEEEEEEDMEVVVELESGKADSDAETISSVVASSTVEATAVVKDEDEPDGEDEDEDVLMMEEPTVTDGDGEEVMEDEEEEVVVKVATPTPSTLDNTAVVEVVVEEGDHEDSKDEPKLEELVDGGEKKGAVDNSVPETTPQTETAEDGTAAQSNGGIVPDGEEQQSTVASNQQQTPRLEKAPIGCSSSGSSATPKASAKSTGGTGASSSSSSGSSTSSVKEGKSKSRTGKEKSKDDEKTREEKLRQEKLRVEEKVREEKLRAELRLKEELEQKQKKKEAPVVVLENGTGEDVSSLVGGSSSPSTVTGEKSTADAERELKTDQAVTALIKLPAITIMQKDSISSSNKNTVGGTTKRKSSRDAVESVGETVKVELEILPIPSDAAAPLTAVKEEKSSVEATLPSVDSVESPLEIISKSEQAAAAVTITVQKAVVDGVADGNKSPVPSSSSSPSALSVIKIESDPTSSDGAGVEAATSADGSGEGASKKDTTSTGGKEGKRNGTDALVAQLPTDKASILQVVSGTKDEEPQKAPEAASAPSTTAPPRLDESDDVAKQKESHLKLFGLLTIRAACEEMKRRTEQKPSTSTTGALVGEGGAAAGGPGAAGEGWLAAAIGQSGSSSGGSGGGRNGNKSTRGSRDEYTVSMKTSAALGGKGGGGGSGRGEKRKQQRMPLKMTFQKGKGKGSSGGGGNGGAVRDSSNGSGTSSSNGSSAMTAGGYATEAGNNGQGDASTFYTIHSNELDHHSSNSSDGHSHRDSSTGGRKAHSRSHTTDGVNLSEAVGESSSTDKVIQKSLVIPEKASSFNVHPERLCQDQCFYCGGKFGLYDTPCHIAAIKSTERQQKILLAESKITLDSCLCDACFRHVDRKANYPSQKKKTSSSGGPQQNSASSSGASSSGGNAGSNTQSTVSPIVIKMTTNKDGSTSITGQQNHHHQPMVIDDGSGGPGSGKAREICAVRQCTAHALQALRRKWVLKMKRKIGKHLDINLEQAARATTENISICNRHYEQISHLMICAMCTKPLQRNQVYHMYNNIPQLERLIQEQGLAIRLSSSELVVCKLCRHYANLLFKPPDPKSQKAQFISTYNRRLCSSRQRETKEQNELQQQQQQQDVEVQSVEPLLGGASVNDGETAVGRQSTVDIVISDGDEEENEEEDVEVHQQPASQQKFQKVSELFSIGENSVSLRRRGSSRKSPDVSIIESSSSNNSMAQMSDRLGEITIIPTTKTFTSTNHHNQQQQQQQDDNFDMTRVLKSNPNISMRELFPGEEELGVHVNIPFSSSSMRTPEGWTKVTSTIQYDDSTRALWEELQKPYGNQSSFLRHLILLEKYFRNGDLVLSPQAKTNATTYSEAVQNRLRSFDHVPTPLTSPPALASFAPATATSVQQQQDKTTSIFQQFSSATITIVPASKARPKAPSSQGPGTSGSGSSSSSGNSSNTAASPEGASVASVAPVSLLKSNNLRLSVSEKVSVNSLKRKLSNEGKSTSGSTSAAATTAPGSASSAIVSKVAKLDEPKGVPSAPPPELISINRKSTGTAISAIPTTTLTASTATAPASSKPQPQQQQSLLQPATTQPAQQSQSSNQAQGKRSPPSYAASTAGGASTSASSTNIDHRDVIHVMPEQLTETEREETSAKPWRPTLLPIAPGVTESLKYGPLYQTADGRLLPMLVQVMSGGKPYHISIGDYNRMCILRREKLIQQQHNNTQSTTTAAAAAAVASSTAVTAVAKRSSLPARPAATTTTTSTSPGSTAASLPPPGLRLSLSSTENTPISSGSTTITPSTNASTAAASARLVQVPNQILEQNSLIPIAGGSTLGGGSGGGSRLDLYRQKQNSSNTSNNSSSLTVTMTTSNNNNNNNNNNHSLAKTSISAANTVKPLSLPNSTTVYPMVISANTISFPSASGNASSLAGSGGGNGGGPLGLMYSQASSIGRSNAATSLVLTQQQSTASSNTVNVSVNSSSSSISNPLDQLLKGGKHVTQSQLQAFAAAAASSNGGLAGSLLDNSPAQLLSKIPKSLTVIPQQKQRSMSRVSSHEDQHSA